MTNIGIIFAGGSGARMGSGKPKQFLEINGKPIIIHTLEIFEDNDQIDKIYVACKEDYINKLKKLIKKFRIEKVVKIVAGGKTGQDSIEQALLAAKADNEDDSIVLIHDGVRPCIDDSLIESNIKSVKEFGTGVTCTPAFETPLISKEGHFVEESPLRNWVYTAQAPQSFRLGEILKAYETAKKENPEYKGIVDSCTLMKSVGNEVKIVLGPRGNIKVTTPEDLYIFRAMLEYQETENVFGLLSNEVEGKLTR